MMSMSNVGKAKVALVCAVAACGAPATQTTKPVIAPPPAAAMQSFSLPGTSGPVTVDFIAYERARDRVWVPVGETGSVDVLDVASHTFARVDGFKTQEREVRGRKRTMGPSSVAFGEGVAFIGNRASNEVCTVDTTSLHVGTCVTLDSAPDALAWVPATHEVWATTPKEPSITILDAAPTLHTKTKIRTAGEPEGCALGNGTFLTNYEDKNTTAVIDVASHEVKATWPLQCSDGPRGIAADASRGLAIVACTNGLEALDTKDGHVVGKLDVGDGVDLIDMVDGTIYVAASKAARMTVARADVHGALTAISTIETRPGVRNAVVDAHGRVYAVDPIKGELLVMSAP
jgi:hypothetical protein